MALGRQTAALEIRADKEVEMEASIRGRCECNTRWIGLSEGDAKTTRRQAHYFSGTDWVIANVVYDWISGAEAHLFSATRPEVAFHLCCRYDAMLPWAPHLAHQLCQRYSAQMFSHDLFCPFRDAAHDSFHVAADLTLP